jgi:hypothetical protein
MSPQASKRVRRGAPRRGRVPPRAHGARRLRVESRGGAGGRGGLDEDAQALRAVSRRPADGEGAGLGGNVAGAIATCDDSATHDAEHHDSPLVSPFPIAEYGFLDCETCALVARRAVEIAARSTGRACSARCRPRRRHVPARSGGHGAGRRRYLPGRTCWRRAGHAPGLADRARRAAGRPVARPTSARAPTAAPHDHDAERASHHACVNGSVEVHRGRPDVRPAATHWEYVGCRLASVEAGRHQAHSPPTCASLRASRVRA